MSPADERSLAHARAVLARGAALPPHGLPSPDILDSWVRCASARLDVAAPPPLVVVGASDLAGRRERLDPVRRLAQAEIETLLPQIAGSNFLLAFADQEGVILDLFADNRFQMNASDTAIVVGSCWSEALCGTNGLGTALATGRSIAVNGLEHYFFKHGDISCAASPIRDVHGQVVGVLDASSYVGSRQQHTQALVQMAATHVENQLLMLQMRDHLVLAVHPRPEFLATLSCGLIAFDAEGRVSAVNARAQGLLTGLSLRRGTPFEALFDDTFDRVAAQTRGDGDLRLRDVLGSVLMARCVQAARAPLGPRAVGSASMAMPAPASVAATRSRLAGSARPALPSNESPSQTPRMIADDPGVVEAMRLAQGAVRLHVPVLIMGETGTGKELLARYAHLCSGRSGAFVAINCGALPAELFEAELFGYAGGAFTGSRREGSTGLIEAAHGGTLLLDEIGELALPLQAVLLRFLDDQHVRQVGGTRSRRVDVQLLAATHRDLEAELAAGSFRADLWHRLNVVCLRLPPLRERRDFSAVARSILGAIDASARLADEAVERLSRHVWRGNMRELRSVLTRALLTHPTGRLVATDFDPLLPEPPIHKGAPSGSHSVLQQDAMQRVLSEFERTGRSVSQTSRNLEISRTTVYRYLHEGAVRLRRAHKSQGAASGH